MADLEFSKHVSEIPAGESLPRPYTRSVGADITPFPDIQSSISNYANSTNWMSSIGSTVAARASNAIAVRIGSELGKNPQGDIGIPITDFDKTMQESYRTQSQATLGLQANKLINDSNLEIASTPRVTPDLISKTNKNISLGLKNIIKNAPIEVQSQMEYQFGNMWMEQNSLLTQRMIREQKQDRQNNTAMASQMNSEHAYSFGLNGNEKAALAAIDSTKKLNDADVAARLMTPQDAKTNVDAARKSYLSGKMIHEYENARAEGKGEDYLKTIADKKPSYLNDSDYMNVTSNLMNYINHQDSLRSQDQQLRLSKFSVDIAKNPMAITGSDMQELKNNVSATAFEKAQLSYITAMKTFNKQQYDISATLRSWNDPGSFARAPEKAINQGFDMMVQGYVKQRQEQGNPITQEEAEVQVAASAGGKVPIFVETLKNKINSGNPQMMDSAARQMDEIYSMNSVHALNGLNDQDKSIFTQYKSLRDSLPPEEAAKIAIQNSNQDPDTQNMNKEKWSAFIKTQTGGVFGSTPPTDWALKKVDLDKDEFMNPGIANEYGNMILQKYAAFYQMTNGDKENALKLTKQEVKENYGYTGVNGGKFMTLHPIEKVLGYNENSDVVPFIQQDVMRNLNKNFVPLKEAFNKNESNVYWDIVPNDMKNKALLFGHDYAPVKVKRYTKTSTGVKTDIYDVVLVGNSFNWDLVLSTDSGMRPLIQIAPYLGVHTYTPDKKQIDSEYMKSHRGK